MADPSARGSQPHGFGLGLLPGFFVCPGADPLLPGAVGDGEAATVGADVAAGADDDAPAGFCGGAVVVATGACVPAPGVGVALAPVDPDGEGAGVQIGDDAGADEDDDVEPYVCGGFAKSIVRTVGTPDSETTISTTEAATTPTVASRPIRARRLRRRRRSTTSDGTPRERLRRFCVIGGDSSGPGPAGTLGPDARAPPWIRLADNRSVTASVPSPHDMMNPSIRNTGEVSCSPIPTVRCTR